MDETTIQGKLEALLFLFGEPVKLDKLADVLGLKLKDVEEAVEALTTALKNDDRGLHIIVSEDRVQITTKPVLGPLLSKIAQEELDSNLTPASMETLAIVAYLGPCRRSLVEHIRGVNSSFILRSLLIRGLVERKPDPKRQNTFLYQVSMDFLRHMGVGSTKELPEYEKYKEFTKLFIGGEGDTSEKGDEQSENGSSIEPAGSSSESVEQEL
ncbi:MAG: SMC-Scp complex subunit ScpB [Candidatus Colwellbacteria bacterium RIFCSPLOWO2_12_FULL_46_17]|uniref:SMC-Scp complex subunit ScpB n=1 Tax=Candidatus Colwellbacteria bacterium RIFCSPLOWO2_12_FULL_46_17 TaxID=1797695 RepID=A0A1G1ZB92_9BACT|nr:MAG: SMC-Scp complex subunit ScpB [Candidatus Colwellbacteria bacterium RIFCSPLOWO2_12_FULL_46_17]